jgi:hypothetical protein
MMHSPKFPETIYCLECFSPLRLRTTAHDNRIPAVTAAHLCDTCSHKARVGRYVCTHCAKTHGIMHGLVGDRYPSTAPSALYVQLF